jgi:phosphate transport system substrate-binding protein
VDIIYRSRLIGGAVLVSAGALALSACGSDNNSSSGTPSTGASSAATSSIVCSDGSLLASGSTAQGNAMSEWIKAYQTKCSGATINYGGGGSGAGVTQFTAGSVDFAGSDFPLNSEQQPAADKRCGTGKAINVPLVPGGIAIGYNLSGVTAPLNLSAATLAGIFSGKITKWDDTAIKTDNPGVTLPSTAIQTYHRSDGSGTSYNFTNYLAHDAGSAWTYGANKTWPAPGGQGAKGTSAVAQGVKSTDGGIGYMELSYAKQSSISYAKLGNAQGKFVELTTANVTAFLSHATAAATSGNMPLTFDYANADPTAYPNVLVTYTIVCDSGNKADKLPLLKNFLSYAASSDGQGLLEGASYVPMPANLISGVQTTFKGLS